MDKYHISFDEDGDESRAVGIDNKAGESVLAFTEHTDRELGERVCRFLNSREAARDEGVGALLSIVKSGGADTDTKLRAASILVSL